MNVVMLLLCLILIFGGGWFIGKAAIDIEKYKNCDHFGEVLGVIMGLFFITLGIIFICLISAIF